MRILLVRRGLYLSHSGQWSAEAAQARVFPHVPDAVLEAAQRGWIDVDVLLAWDDPRYDIRLAIGPRRAHTTG